MLVSIAFTYVWGVLQLVLLGSFARTTRLSTILIAIPAGLYGCAMATALLQIVWTRPFAWLSSIPLDRVVALASYTLDPFIEEVVKLLPLIFLLRIQKIARQWSLTDCILIGAGLGAGFGLAESLFRFSMSPTSLVIGMPFGWVIQKGLTPITVFSPFVVLTSWLPEAVSFGELLSFQTTPRNFNLHLAWSAIGGLAVGLFFLRTGQFYRVMSGLMLLYICMDHAASNADLSQPSEMMSLLATPFRFLRQWLGLVVVITIAAAWWLDRQQQGDNLPENLLNAERDTTPPWKGTMAAAWSNLPWSLIWVYGFVRIRRAYKTLGVHDADNALRPVMNDLRTGVDLAISQSAKPRLLQSSLTGSNITTLLRQPKIYLGLALMVLCIMWFVVGGNPSMAWIQQTFTTAPAWITLLVISVPSLLWAAHRIVLQVRQWSQTVTAPIGDPAAILAFRTLAGTGSLVLGTYALLLGLIGHSPHDKLLTNHLLNALSSGPVLTGLMMALLAVAFIFFLPEIIAALPLINAALMAYGLHGAVTGKDLLTGRKLERWEKALNLIPVLLEAIQALRALKGGVSLAEALSELAADTRGAVKLGNAVGAGEEFVEEFPMHRIQELIEGSEMDIGHMKDKHLVDANTYLADRLINNPQMTTASTFNTYEEAERAVATALRENMDKILTWSAEGATGRLALNIPFSGGSVLQRGATHSVIGTGARMVLEGDGAGGWTLLTGFPTP